MLQFERQFEGHLMPIIPRENSPRFSHRLGNGYTANTLFCENVKNAWCLKCTKNRRTLTNGILNGRRSKKGNTVCSKGVVGPLCVYPPETLQSMINAKLIRIGFGPTMETGSSRRFKRCPTTYM